jgi:hypothetical protein
MPMCWHCNTDIPVGDTTCPYCWKAPWPQENATNVRFATCNTLLCLPLAVACFAGLDGCWAPLVAVAVLAAPGVFRSCVKSVLPNLLITVAALIGDAWIVKHLFFN